MSDMTKNAPPLMGPMGPTQQPYPQPNMGGWAGSPLQQFRQGNIDASTYQRMATQGGKGATPPMNPLLQQFQQGNLDSSDYTRLRNMGYGAVPPQPPQPMMMNQYQWPMQNFAGGLGGLLNLFGSPSQFRQGSGGFPGFSPGGDLGLSMLLNLFGMGGIG